ncbi:MAG TPA: glycosyltransferase family 2 protein [Candidatus Eremiobacteraeota bacterium]|nr:MAG: Undecaprenyl-phosphate 4-deoxy-4-formamido-L-arabinose transferase [bacterium ADurb.Bin363]HPZ07638.1 glycosyltransferase family 2 protein [Candidatus Eremiobacteraeota bacterium]
MENKKIQKRSLSFIIPVYNEEKTIKLLFEKIVTVMTEEHYEVYEVIFIDDGSQDDSWREIKKLSEEEPAHIVAIRFRKNLGKSLALGTGFQRASGDLIFTMDSDLQDDPAEIPIFIKKLDEGYDIVSGWKKKRYDPITKTMPSKLFNLVTSLAFGLKLHDFNCGFKLYKKEVVKALELYGELHRYIPVLAKELGFKISEVPVLHHPRTFGKSKYGWERYTRGFLDLLTVITITKYLERPSHLFGGLGIILGSIGSFLLLYVIILWLEGYRPVGNRPIFFFGILGVISSIQFISLGLLAELINKKSDRTGKVKNIIAEICDRKKEK